MISLAQAIGALGLLAGCTTVVAAPSVPKISAPIKAKCEIDGQPKACTILLSEDYAKIEQALCAGREGCKLGD